MKVVQVLPELNGGGVERGTLEIAKYLSAHGHESHVVSAGGGLVRELEVNGATHHMCEVVAKSPRSFLGIFQLRRLILQLKPDIIHVRSRIPGWVVELAYATLPKMKQPARVSTFHGFHSVNCYSAVMTHADRVIAVSKTIADHIQVEYQVPKEKIEVIYRGIDPTYFDPTVVDRKKVMALREQWGVPDAQTPVLLMPGRFTRLKGHALLLEALGAISDIPWYLVLVGDHRENQPYTEVLLAQAERLGIESRIHYHGQSNEMPLVYATADLVLNVSTRPESFGRTAVEAMAMARPVIVAAHGGGMETVIPNETGWLFSPNDADALTACLKKALLDQGNWHVLGENGRQHVVSAFTLEKMCQATLSVYNDCYQRKMCE